MIFDDANGGLVDLKKYHERSAKKEASLSFDPAAWTGPVAPAIHQKDEWIVEV
jgi:hypothetical protein